MKARTWIYMTLGIALFMGIAGFIVTKQISKEHTLSPIGTFLTKEKPLEQYTIDNLSKRTYTPSPISFDTPTATKSSFMVVPFSFFVDDSTSSREAGVEGIRKKVTGLAHIPMTPSSKKMPVIVQLRGFVPDEKYAPGVGTEHSAEVYAANGFLSLAPDFLGYGGSDKASDDVFAGRFETYTTVLSLLASLKTIPFADPDRVFLWGHSNGGHIALTVLTILGEKGSAYPTTVWAPVTARFPYSILYYTDESDDYGKSLRKALAAFEKDYDVDLYAFQSYLSRISAPVLLHQGSADIAVPQKWNDALVTSLKDLKKTVTYHVYPHTDHNMTGSWNAVVARDIQFFTSFLK